MVRAEVFEQEALPELTALQGFAYHLCRDSHYSQDLVQETMLKAQRYIHTYRPGSNCRAWLFQICKNTYINEYRRRQYMPIVFDFQEDHTGAQRSRNEGVRGVSANPMDRGTMEKDSHLFSDEVIAGLSNIPQEYQTALLLSDVEGFTYEEVSEFMGVPIGTTRSRIHRGRKMLAGMLQEYAAHNGYTSVPTKSAQQ